MAKVEEKQSEEVASLIITTSTIIMIISQSKDVSECTPRYIGHDIDSEMASNLRMLCLVVLLLRSVEFATLREIDCGNKVSNILGPNAFLKLKCIELSKKTCSEIWLKRWFAGSLTQHCRVSKSAFLSHTPHPAQLACFLSDFSSLY